MSKAMITVSGFVSLAAEVKQTGQSEDSMVCEFSVPVDDEVKGEKHTVWYRCSIWGKRATALAPFLSKGKGVSIIGRFFPREYKAGSGEARVSYDVKVVEIDLLGGGDRTDQPAAAPRQAAPPPAARSAPPPPQAQRPISPDGLHEWNGQAWVPRAQAAPQPPPPPPANGYGAPPPQAQRGVPF